jgi:hypothetical protein
MTASAFCPRIISTTASSLSGSPCVVQTRHSRPSALAWSSTPLATWAKEGPVMSLITKATDLGVLPDRARAWAFTT